MPDKASPHPNDWVEIHHPENGTPTSKVQRKSFDAVWKERGFKIGPAPAKAKA